MKCKKYIEKLDNLDNEIEEGLLFELQEKPPANLHGEIMKSINKERKRINFFNYRIYAPAVAAVLIFAVVINRPEILEKINFIRNARFTQEQKMAKIESSGTKNKIKNEGTDTATASNDANSAADKKISSNLPEKGSNDTSNGASKPVQQKNNNQNTQNSNKDIKTASGNNIDKSDTSSAGDAVIPEKNTVEGKQLNISDYIGMLFFNEPKINYEIVLDNNKSVILNFITENNEQKLNTANTYKLSMEQFESLDKLLTKYNIHKKAVNESDESGTTSRIIRIYPVNYHIRIDSTAPDVLKFIDDQGKCVKVDEDSYKISTEDMKDFNSLLVSAGIKKELVCEPEDKYVIIKVLMVNYEVSLNSTDDSITGFLNDADKCKPVKDNIYRLNRDNFNKFKELLNNSKVEIKVINETNNQDIFIKVNNV